MAGSFFSVANNTSSIEANGSDGAGSYEYEKEAYVSEGWSESGNSITGEYSGSGVHANGSTATEENTYADGSASFTEILFEGYAVTGSGNSITGDYEREIYDAGRWSTQNTTTIDTAGADAGTYVVGQSTDSTFTRSESGNRVTGAYTKTETAVDVYYADLSRDGASNFTLVQGGTNTYTDSETGNTITGLYTRTKTGTDEYTLQEDGTKAGNPYSQTIIGEEDYTLVDEGNLATSTYTRTITGAGSYDRTTTGAGATLPTDAGGYGYLWEQTGDPHSGTFDLTQSGTDRYDLLEDFYDVSNVQAGQTPGHMNIYPFGQTFVDPFWGDLWEGVESIGNSIASMPSGLAAAYLNLTGNTDAAELVVNEIYPRNPHGQVAGQPGAQQMVMISLEISAIATAAAVVCRAVGYNPVILGRDAAPAVVGGGVAGGGAAGGGGVPPAAAAGPGAPPQIVPGGLELPPGGGVVPPGMIPQIPNGGWARNMPDRVNVIVRPNPFPPPPRIPRPPWMDLPPH